MSTSLLCLIIMLCLKTTPEIGSHDPDIYERIDKIEAAVNRDIGQANCMFHFMLHEFEGILFSNPESFELNCGNRCGQQNTRDSRKLSHP